MINFITLMLVFFVLRVLSKVVIAKHDGFNWSDFVYFLTDLGIMIWAGYLLRGLLQ